MEELLPSVFGKPFEPILLEQPYFPDFEIPYTNLRTPEIPYSTYYIINLPMAGISDKLIGVAFGIFADFQMQYEKAQGIDPRCSTYLFYIREIGHCSSFSNEDLPSDYLGFVSQAKSMSYEQIIQILDPSGGEAHEEAPVGYWGKMSDRALCALGFCGEDTPFNNCFSLKVLDELTGKFVNRAWPQALQISPPIGFGTYWGRDVNDFIFGAPIIPTP